MGQHSPIPPDDCASCVRIFAVLTQHYEASGAKLLAVELGQRVGLKERALRVHLGYLETHRRIESDRRTPVPGATVEPTAPPQPNDAWPDPLDWALTIECPDKTCRRMLRVMAARADRTGAGQMGLQDLADAMGCSVRTAQTHRQHLVAAKLVQVEPDGDRYPSGHPLRRPDRYVLASQRDAPYSGQSWAEDSALDILHEVPWWPGAAPGETTKAVGRLLQHLRRGWPREELIRRLTRVQPDHVISRIALLRKLCPNLREAYVVPAMEHMEHLAEVAGPVEQVICPECERQYPRAQRVYEGQVCRDCRPAGALSGVPIIRGGSEPLF